MKTPSLVNLEVPTSTRVIKNKETNDNKQDKKLVNQPALL